MLQGISLKKGERERQRERKRERERERKKETEARALAKQDLQLYFQKELLYPELHISRSERCRVMQKVLNKVTFLWSKSVVGYKKERTY